ncbi:hypothetical protein RvY_18487 [Ramazzottius varieornatus]|uniref:Uncharacterized protein n=1 Tax=Ramazzottius varieornatus TaxID=947166 RepID=A0A1D1W6B9_RAMVA|nr:hypothetical protein RvY_18487 [Ramazzottius varieornatus]
MAYAELSQAIILRHGLKCAPCGEAHPEKLQQLLLLTLVCKIFSLVIHGGFSRK